MSENIRIIFENSYDVSIFEDPYDDTKYYTEAGTNNIPNAPVILGPAEATSSLRSDLMSVKPTTHFILDGSFEEGTLLSCLAFVRPQIPADSSVTLKLWDDTWTGSLDDELNYIAKLNVDTIAKLGGWGDFPWIYPWGSNFLSSSPMSSVLVFWFDNPNSSILTFTDTNGDTVPSPVSNITQWRLEVETTDTSAMYFDRIYLGNHMDIDYNISHGHNMIFQDSTKQYRTDGGSLVTDIHNRFKQIKFAFSVISPSNRNTFARHMAIAGLHKDMLVSIYPLNTSQELEDDYTLVGKFRKIPIMTEIIGGYYKTTIEVEET